MRKTKCQYRGCKRTIQIGNYCWGHNPYSGMYDPKENKKLEVHWKMKKKRKPKLLKPSFEFIDLPPTKRLWLRFKNVPKSWDLRVWFYKGIQNEGLLVVEKK